MNILSTNNLTKYYGAEPLLVKAIDGISLEIEQGSFTAIVGAVHKVKRGWRSEERPVWNYIPYRNSKKLSCGHPKDRKGIIQKGMEVSDSLRERITGCGAERLYGD